MVSRTDKHDPSYANGTEKPSISEALNPQAKREAAPSADKVFCCLPKEDSDAPTGNPSNEGR
jgi:hypothetical protein